MLIKEKLLSTATSSKNQQIFKYKTSAFRWWEQQYLWHYFVVCSVSSSLTKTSQSHILNCSCSMPQLNSRDMFITNDRLYRILFFFCRKTTATLFFSVRFSSSLYAVHDTLPVEISILLGAFSLRAIHVEVSFLLGAFQNFIFLQRKKNVKRPLNSNLGLTALCSISFNAN